MLVGGCCLDNLRITIGDVKEQLLKRYSPIKSTVFFSSNPRNYVGCALRTNRIRSI